MEFEINSPKFGRKTVIIDDEDWEKIQGYKWRVNKRWHTFYVKSQYRVGKKYKNVLLHRLVMNVLDKPNLHIDHIDGDPLNNRKGNLRTATIIENSRNVGFNSRNTTGFKGVYQYKKPHPSAGKFTATLRCKAVKIHGGYFNTAVEAAIRYNELSKQYHGEFAYQNPIPNV